ncbi:MAG: glutamate mutase L [Candidatus Bathyarchaeota archaeon]|nr:MAG: glutamate mutase L [Candidatus Bathyarchaeota archaeon]
MDSEKLSYLIVDIDNNRTKAAYIEKTGDGYSFSGTNEAPTTVDQPDLDVTIGVENAVRGLGQRLGKELWGSEGPSDAHRFLCSSSTSEGIYMTVAGLVRNISAESAQRAALGAGALLMDVFSKDDHRPRFVLIERMRSLRPEVFLLAGGTDGGAEAQVLEMAGLMDAADVKPRFGAGYKLPVVYAGNVEVRGEVSKVLTEDKYATRVVDNVRPLIEIENLGPAREGIYDSYMEHVIIHSPGYDKLVKWVEGNIIPTQAAIGKILYAYAQERAVNLLAVDVGGATTDVYSVHDGIFNRSLDADIGMTYGISNIMKEAGVQNIMRWIPGSLSERKVRNIVSNIMALQPEVLTDEEAMVQQAAVKEAIRLGLEQHKSYATRLKGVQLRRPGEMGVSPLSWQILEPSILNLMKTQVVIGRGSTFNDPENLRIAALLLLDAIQPGGVTEIFVDSSSIMPHLGMLLDSNRAAALQILSNLCLRKLGTCVAAKGKAGERVEAMRLHMSTSDGALMEETIAFGELKTLPLGADESAKIEVNPTRRFDVGAGRGRRLEAVVTGGENGVIIDARGRPMDIPGKKEVLSAWAESLKPRLTAPIPTQ